MADLETLLRTGGEALAVLAGPLPSLAGLLKPRLPAVDLDHLHLVVRDLDASAAFYRDWFGFDGDVIDGTLFAHNRAGFLLCLSPGAEPARLNDAHFGFNLRSVEHL